MADATLLDEADAWLALATPRRDCSNCGWISQFGLCCARMCRLDASYLVRIAVAQGAAWPAQDSPAWVTDDCWPDLWTPIPTDGED